MSNHHRIFAGAVFLALAAVTLSGQAQGQPGARCPGDTPAADFTPQFSNNTLRCQRRGVAQPVCPPTHPVYDVRNGADICRTANVMVPPPTGALTAPPQCGPNMSMQIDGGVGDRDRCRSNTTDQVLPLLGSY